MVRGRRDALGKEFFSPRILRWKREKRAQKKEKGISQHQAALLILSLFGDSVQSYTEIPKHTTKAGVFVPMFAIYAFSLSLSLDPE